MKRDELIKRYNAGERDFYGIRLKGANLARISLINANLNSAFLQNVNLTNVNLTNVNLTNANLTNANLTNAILTNVSLAYTDFTDANLQGTCLDPKASVPETDLSELETDKGYVIGYRTKESICRGCTLYQVGNHYVTPWFSICKKTDDHPGIYLAPLAWIKLNYPNYILVKVKALKEETLKVGDKYRAKQIWVLEDV